MVKHDIASSLYLTNIEFRKILARLEDIDEVIRQHDPQDKAINMICDWQKQLDEMRDEIIKLSDRFYDEWLKM